jgi:hypothetical protein
VRKALAVLAAALLAGAPAAANDSIAETAAGGLVLTRTDAIDMVSEDLFVSAAKVEVKYVFRNVTARDVKATVAFPLPEIEQGADYDVAVPEGFETFVDEVPVRMSRERKALLGGKDYSVLLALLKVPLSEPRESDEAAIAKALQAVTPDEQAHLVKLGLAEWEAFDRGRGPERQLVPRWSVKETYYWEQVFPAGRDLRVEHRYVPGTGGSVGSGLAYADFRRSAEGREMMARYCVDQAFVKGVERLAKAGGDYAVLPEQRISYILHTGANWKSPIGRFRLTVDKGAPENLVSFCWGGTAGGAGGVKKVSGTRFEMRREGWRPDRDLHILIVQPQPKPSE